MEVASILLNRVLSKGVKRNASSIHFSVGSLPMIRISGELSILQKESIITLEIIEGIINSIIPDEEKARLEQEKEIIFVKDFTANLRFRVNIYYQKNLPTITFHYIAGAIKSLEELKLPKVVANFTKIDSGLFIIAGPYGSGKTTTAISFIEEINKTKNKYIVTLEDPVEQLFVSKKSIINQRQIGRDVNSVFEGLRFCLNEDVDLVYISKVKKDFTDIIPITLNLAAGSCLVIMEINAHSSISALEKMVDAAVAKSSRESALYSLADALVGIVVQQFLPKKGGGLTLAYEVLMANPAVKSLIRDDKLIQIESILQISKQEGMISMDKSIEKLTNSGEIK